MPILKQLTELGMKPLIKSAGIFVLSLIQLQFHPSNLLPK